ncbi:hypothetical protein ACFL1S_01245 [Pseudomonadota bacterium]
MGIWFQSVCGQHNEADAAQWFMHAAEQGHKEAQYRLANQYYSGRGVSKDIDQAEKWYREAALQGHLESSRMLGDIYSSGRYVPKDLEEAENWYRVGADLGDETSQRKIDEIIKEKDPLTWKHREQARQAKRREKAQALAAKRLEEERKREIKKAEEERFLAGEKSKKAMSRFGSIEIRVTEPEETKRLRNEHHLRRVSTDEGSTDFVDSVQGGALVGVHVGGPVGAGVGAVIGLVAAIVDAVSGYFEEKLSDEEKAQIKAAIRRVSAAFAKENVAGNLQNQILELSRKQQAPDLFTISSAPYQLRVEVQEIGMFITPENPRYGRLWTAVEASLIDTRNKSDPVLQRICYGSSEAKSLVAMGELDGGTLRDGLTTAYRYIANQIQTDIIGLAPVPDSPRTWHKTALACVKSNQRESTVSEGKR